MTWARENASSAESLNLPPENTAALFNKNHRGWQVARGQDGGKHLQLVLSGNKQFRSAVGEDNPSPLLRSQGLPLALQRDLRAPQAMSS